ncbi:hypothetical protein [Pseudomonas sp. HMWF034]|uniref:oxidoreductase n=1 Tax=Pseudomonas sp. HMWF034 TaxID=2056867 RepID=UPI00273AEC5D|nr:hypothetical protein [Pseudomonas sp. HMWF034]
MRTDQYSGSVENRKRFLLETIDSVAAEIAGSKTDVGCSPFGHLYDACIYDGENKFRRARQQHSMSGN